MDNKIETYRENTCPINLSITNPDKTPKDITGATVYFTVKPEFDNAEDDSTAKIKVEITDHTDPTAGLTQINLTPTQTNIPADDYVYDVKVKLANTEQYTMVTGKFVIKEVATLRA